MISAVLPLTYAYDALAKVAAGGPYGWRFVLDVGVTIGATLVALALAAATLKRRTPYVFGGTDGGAARHRAPLTAMLTSAATP